MLSDEELIDKVMPNFGYQLFFKKDETPEILDKIADLFLQPMFSLEFRKQNEKNRHAVGFSSNEWVRKGRLEASAKRMLEARQRGEAPQVPSEKVCSRCPAMARQRVDRARRAGIRRLPQRFP